MDNCQKISAVLADYGFNCIRSADNRNSTDLLVLHMPSGNMLPSLLKSRLTLAGKYGGKGLWMAFPFSEDRYLPGHDRLRDIVGERTPALENKSWQQDVLLSSSAPTTDLLEGIEPYRIPTVLANRGSWFDP